MRGISLTKKNIEFLSRQYCKEFRPSEGVYVQIDDGYHGYHHKRFNWRTNYHCEWNLRNHALDFECDGKMYLNSKGVPYKGLATSNYFTFSGDKDVFAAWLIGVAPKLAERCERLRVAMKVAAFITPFAEYCAGEWPTVAMAA